jgi:hypothetical protein
VVASFWLALSATAQEFPTAPVDASTASLYAPAASVDTSVASVDTSVASVDAPTSALDTSLASVDTPTSPLDAPAASVDAPVSPLDAPATSVGGPASSLDASASADASAAGAEADSTALSIEPIAGGDAAPDAEGSAAYAEASGEELRKVIPQAFLFRVATGAMVDDNIFQTEFDTEDDLMLQATLGLTFAPQTEGNATFSFDYGATGFTYLDHSDLNAINHALSLTGGLKLPKTTLGVSGNYQRSEGGEPGSLQLSSSGADNVLSDTSSTTDQRARDADREAGQFSPRDVMAASLTAQRELATKTHLDTALSYSGTLYDDEEFQSTSDLSGRLGLSYDVTSKTSLGVAGVYGLLDNGDNPTQTYQNLLLTSGYTATGKLVFRGQAGVDFRQYDAVEAGAVPQADQDDTTRFVFNIGAAYQLRERTSLQLGASRSTDGSAIAGTPSIQRTSATLSLNQGIGQRLAFSMAGGYDLSDYGSETDGNQLAEEGTPLDERQDNNWFTRASLNMMPTSRITLGVFYEYRQNDSGGSGMTYEANRYGINAAVSF